MKRPGAPGTVFVALGVAFIAIGISGQRAFIAIGAAFLAVGLVLVARNRRPDGST
jgi:hypothetical protein